MVVVGAISPYSPRRRLVESLFDSTSSQLDNAVLPCTLITRIYHGLIRRRFFISAATIALLVHRHFQHQCRYRQCENSNLNSNSNARTSDLSAYIAHLQQVITRIVRRLQYSNICQWAIEQLHSHASWWSKFVAILHYRHDRIACGAGPQHSMKSSMNGNHEAAMSKDIPRNEDGTKWEHHIQSILNFWFPPLLPIDHCQKSLWMITDAIKLQQMDKYIYETFGTLLLTCSRYDDDNNSNCESVTQNEWFNYGWEGALAYIILLDQFSRHIIRHLSLGTTDNNSCHVQQQQQQQQQQQIQIHLLKQIQQQELDSMALSAAQRFQTDYNVLIQSGCIPLSYHIFSLMPFRHYAPTTNSSSSNEMEQQQQQQHNKSILLDAIEHWTSMQQQNESLLKRFRNATNRRLNNTTLEQQQQQEGQQVVEGRKVDTTPDNYDDILECHSCNNKNMSMANKHPVFKIIQAFLLARGVINIMDSTDQDFHQAGKWKKKNKKKNISVQSIDPEDHIHNLNSKENPGLIETESDDVAVLSTKVDTTRHNQQQRKTVIVSLSGGVDSMVIASVLSRMADPSYSLPNDHYSSASASASSSLSSGPKLLNVVAVHIDYGNRRESRAEASYVEHYCKEGNITCYSRRIDEVTRGVTARDEYERISREVRYGFYKDVIAVQQQQQQQQQQCHAKCEVVNSIGVILGHHKGDLRENVLSNACRGCGPLDLSGMGEVGTIEGVSVWRPFLPLEKSIVYDYAHKFGVPYFKDTTPMWSTRFKLRSNLLPVIQDVYGEGSLVNLSNLAIESDSARALLMETVLQPFFASVRYYPMGISFQSSSWKKYDTFFWKFVLREVLHLAGRGMFGDRTVGSFLERIRAIPLRPGWLQCRKDYAVYLLNNGNVYILNPETFPWANGKQYKVAGIPIEVGVDSSLSVGPWTVSTEIVDVANNDEAEMLLHEKAYSGIDNFMNGTIRYHLQAPDIPPGYGLYLVDGYQRNTRPAAWKSMDLRIETTLPLVGLKLDSVGIVNASTLQDSVIIRVILTTNKKIDVQEET